MEEAKDLRSVLIATIFRVICNAWADPTTIGKQGYDAACPNARETAVDNKQTIVANLYTNGSGIGQIRNDFTQDT